jgi:hypothetical protein
MTVVFMYWNCLIRVLMWPKHVASVGLIIFTWLELYLLSYAFHSTAIKTFSNLHHTFKSLNQNIKMYKLALKRISCLIPSTLWKNLPQKFSIINTGDPHCLSLGYLFPCIYEEKLLRSYMCAILFQSPDHSSPTSINHHI